MISLGPMQAVECRLDFDADLSMNSDVVPYFVDLVENNEYVMRVLNVLPAKVLLVDLIDKTTNQNIKDVLMQRFIPRPISPLPDSKLSRSNFRSTNGPSGTCVKFSLVSRCEKGY
jgi:hypothetical protein